AVAFGAQDELAGGAGRTQHGQGSAILSSSMKNLSTRHSPPRLAGSTEISAALVQPLVLISCRAVNRKYRASTASKGASCSTGLLRMFPNLPAAMLVVQRRPSRLVSNR